jgi:hypothetical protein
VWGATNQTFSLSEGPVTLKLGSIRHSFQRYFGYSWASAYSEVPNIPPLDASGTVALRGFRRVACSTTIILFVSLWLLSGLPVHPAVLACGGGHEDTAQAFGLDSPKALDSGGQSWVATSEQGHALIG